jgi:hypothetical protein
MKFIILSGFLLIISIPVLSQDWPLIDDGLYKNPSDPSRPYSSVSLSGELFDLVEGQLWQYSPEASLAFSRHRDQLSIRIPVVRTEIPGYESFSGIGDIALGYSLVFYERKSISSSLINATANLNISFPTGDQYVGHGVGRTVIVPGITLAFKPIDAIGIYPSVQYILSAKPTTGNWAGGFPGAVPDQTGSNPEERLSALLVNSQFNLEFNKTWFGLTPILSIDFRSNDYTVNLRPEIGKLFGESFMLKINSTVYILGERRLLYWTQFVAGYYF